MNSIGIINGLTLIFFLIIIENVKLHEVKDLPVRVINGNGYQGSVEVYDTKLSKWFPVCSDTFNDKAANVICNMLGFTSVSGAALTYSYKDIGWSGNVSCNGDERFLSDCLMTHTKERSCELAGVDCSKSGKPDGFFIFAGQHAIDRVDDTTWAYIEITSHYDGTFRGLSYDAATDNIYWIYRGIQRLSDLNGQLQKLPLKLKYKSYTGMALDSSQRILFLGVNAPRNGGLFTLQLAPTGLTVPKRIIGGSFYHLQVDPVKKKLYWFNAKKYQIQEADYDGKNVRVVMTLKKVSTSNVEFVLDDTNIYVAFTNEGNILVHERYGKKTNTIHNKKDKGYRGLTQWNGYLYLVAIGKTRILKVKKDGSSVQSVGPLLEDADALRRIVHYGSKHVKEVSLKINKGVSEKPGAVQVYDKTTSKWLSVCSDTFGIREAKVVCKMLGYKSGEQNVAKAGQGSGYGWNMDITCRGDESDLRYCRLRPEKPRKCYFVGLKCTSSSGEEVHSASLSAPVIIIIITVSVTVPPLIVGIVIFILRRFCRSQYSKIIPLKDPEEKEQLQRDAEDLLKLVASN